MLRTVFFRSYALKLPKGITIKKIVTKSNDTPKPKIPKKIPKHEILNDTSNTDQQEDSQSSEEDGVAGEEQENTNKQRKSSKFVKVRSTKYMCIMCNATFSNFVELNKHVTSDVPCAVIIISCPICGKEFTNKSSCGTHVKSHTEKVRYTFDNMQRLMVRCNGTMIFRLYFMNLRVTNAIVIYNNKETNTFRKSI